MFIRVLKSQYGTLTSHLLAESMHPLFRLSAPSCQQQAFRHSAFQQGHP